MTMARFVQGKPQMVPYTEASPVSAGDVVIVGPELFVSHEDIPSYTGGTTVGSLSAGGGIYEVAADAAYGVGTYAHWNPSGNQVTGTPTPSTVPFGPIVAGPTGQVSDGGPTGSGSLCLVLHQPSQLNVTSLALQYNVDTSTTNANANVSKVSGAREVVLNMTGTLAANATLTMPTAAALAAAVPYVQAGQSYKLRIINSSSGAYKWTVTTNTGLTLTGTMDITQNTWREFLVTFTSLTAVTIQAIGTGTQS